jgi:hypothetical protein
MQRDPRTLGRRKLGWATPALALALATGLGVTLSGATASACGGFFCGRQPVDQTAERILFEVGPDTVTMSTQISYNGDAADFAWVLPLSDVPDVSSLGVFSQKALNALDSNTGPTFSAPNDSACYPRFLNEGVASAPATASAAPEGAPPVTVYARAEVGPYDVAVVGSDDPSQLVAWLRAAGYRITPAMEPYVAQYTTEGMKFLALKLQETKGVQDIQPFRFTLPGTAPSIPLRMTALAAEPEMSIVAFVLADQRYEGKNWDNVTIADDQIRFNPFSFAYPLPTNWSGLVAHAVDKAGGQGWVTEFAGDSSPYLEQVSSQIQNGNFATPEDRTGAEELQQALQGHPYLTRLYTRLSAEEMTSDPVFGRSALGDVSGQHRLSRIVNGIDQCPADRQASTDPCDFATCGAAGFCRAVPAGAAGTTAQSGDTSRVAGCACLPGATARVTQAPDGSTTVICQDGRLSFLNPGDREDDAAETLPDPCATFSCGDHGQCVAMNLTPTCVCDQGFVAIGSVSTDGVRQMTCIEPPDLVPASFYVKALVALPDSLPGGRDVPITTPLTMPVAQTSEPTPTGDGSFPMPRTNPALATTSTSASNGGCSFALGRDSSGGWAWLALGAALAATRQRRARTAPR